jgi:hypothetical protein
MEVAAAGAPDAMKARARHRFGPLEPSQSIELLIVKPVDRRPASAQLRDL